MIRQALWALPGNPSSQLHRTLIAPKVNVSHELSADVEWLFGIDEHAAAAHVDRCHIEDFSVFNIKHSNRHLVTDSAVSSIPYTAHHEQSEHD